MAELTIVRGGERLVFPFHPPCPLSGVLAESGFAMPHPCGGRGVCLKCAVQLEGDVSEPSPAELKAGVNPVRLKNHPVALDEAAIDRLYHEILR